MKVVPIDNRLAAWCVLPGAGTMGGALASAALKVERRFRFLGYAGTSFGGLYALARGAGMTPIEIVDITTKLLGRRDLLDSGIAWGKATGAFRGKVMDRILRDIFGEKLRMGDLKVPVRVTAGAMNIKRSALVCSRRHPDVQVWRAARATSGLQGVWDLIRLREDDPLTLKNESNARVYGDGGCGLNVPAGAWDDRREPTVVLRFAAQAAPFTLEELLEAGDGGSFGKAYERIEDLLGTVKASAALLMNSASASFPSRKADTIDIVLDVEGDSLDFGLSVAEIERRNRHGALAADRVLALL